MAKNIVTGYKVSLEQRHLTKAKEEFDISVSFKTVGDEVETSYTLRPSQVVDLISKLAGQVNLVMIERWHRQ